MWIDRRNMWPLATKIYGNRLKFIEIYRNMSAYKAKNNKLL